MKDSEKPEADRTASITQHAHLCASDEDGHNHHHSTQSASRARGNYGVCEKFYLWEEIQKHLAERLRIPLNSNNSLSTTKHCMIQCLIIRTSRIILIDLFIAKIVFEVVIRKWMVLCKGESCFKSWLGLGVKSDFYIQKLKNHNRPGTQSAMVSVVLYTITYSTPFWLSIPSTQTNIRYYCISKQRRAMYWGRP